MVDEPQPISPLIDLPECVLTPHLGADTTEAQDNVGIAIAEEVIAALHGEMVPNAVNLPTLQPTELEEMQGYLTLGEYLGKLYYQLKKAAVEKVEIIYTGEVAAMETGMLTRAVLKGVFEPILKERVNYVNAALTAESRGVDVIRKASRHVNTICYRSRSIRRTMSLLSPVLFLAKRRSVSSRSTTISST